jgi:hypothetical protein
MCFSATASFAAGAVLSAAGVGSLRQARQQAELPFAAIPFVFGVQQLIEGVIWLTFRYHAPVLQQTMIYAYSILSHVWWPIYVPFAMGYLEACRRRKALLRGFLAAGLVVGFYLLYALLVRSITVEVIAGHIVYVSPHFYLLPVMVLYVAATCVSGLFSSHRFVNLFGALAFVAFIASYVVHPRALVSIWCYYAALLSLLVYLHLRFRHLGGFPPGPLRSGAKGGPVTDTAVEG